MRFVSDPAPERTHAFLASVIPRPAGTSCWVRLLIADAVLRLYLSDCQTSISWIWRPGVDVVRWFASPDCHGVGSQVFVGLISLTVRT